jgi:hypothetical protein
MTKITKLGVTGIVFAVTIAIAFAAQREQSAHSRQNSGMMMEMPMVAPLFIENQEFSSTLYMVNELNIPATAKITLFDLNGSKIAEKKVEFKPNSQQELSLRQMLGEVSSAVSLGSLRMQPLTTYGVGVLAQLGLTHYGTEETYFDEELLMPSAEGSPILRSVSDDGRSSAVAITSLSAMNAQHISISCVLEHSQLSSTHTLLPNETVVIRPCMEHPTTTFYGAVNTDFTDEPENGHVPKPAGISIRSDGMPGEFSAYGLAFHRNETVNYLSSMNFSDPKMLNSSGFVYAGVPVGDHTNLLPQGNYRPQVSMVNFGDHTAKVQVIFAVSEGEHSAPRELQTITLHPNSAKTLQFAELKGNSQLQNSFIVRSNAAPGVVLSKLVAIGNGQLRELELVGKDEKQLENSGGHPWSIENGAASTLLLFNHSAKAQEFNIRVADNKIVWLKSYTLRTMETKAISINDLIAHQIKDEKGKTLPLNMLRGEAGWMVNASREVSGRILQSNQATAMARNFSCGTCNLICQDPILSPNANLSMKVTDIGNLGVIEADHCNLPCPSGYPTGCPAKQNPTSYGGGGAYTWSGGNSYAGLVGGTTSSSSSWQGLNPGGATARFTVGPGPGLYACPGSGPVTVSPKPDHLVVQSDTTSVVCSSNGTVRRDITYSEVDVNGNNVGTINTKEQFGSKSANTCNTTINTSETCSPDSGGILTDHLWVGCNSVGGSCGYTYTHQQWLYCPSGGGTAVVFATPGDLVVHNNSVTVSGHASFSTGTKIFADGTITP